MPKRIICKNQTAVCILKLFYGYVDNTYRKGGESADGQNSGNPESEQAWTPKDKESKRFLRNPEKLK